MHFFPISLNMYMVVKCEVEYTAPGPNSESQFTSGASLKQFSHQPEGTEMPSFIY